MSSFVNPRCVLFLLTTCYLFRENVVESTTTSSTTYEEIIPIRRSYLPLSIVEVVPRCELFVASNGSSYLGKEFNPISWEGEQHPFLLKHSQVISLDESCRHFLAASGDGGGAIYDFACELATATCVLNKQVTLSLPPTTRVTDVVKVRRTDNDNIDVWIATSIAGLFVYRNDSSVEHVLRDAKLNALEVMNSSVVVTGGPEKLYFLSTSLSVGRTNRPAAVLRRWEWVTKISTGQGGVIDDIITSLCYAPAVDDSKTASSPGGLLYIGTESGLNTFDPHTGFFGRVAADQGLPNTNITRLHVDEESADDIRVWIGTTSGLTIMRRNVEEEHTFQFLNGSRWLASSPPLSSAFRVSAIASGSNSHTVVVVAAPDHDGHGGGGVTWLDVQHNWTLQMKADHYEQMLRQRHDRHGLASECAFASFGGGGGGGFFDRKENCTGVDSDNDGLWTSLVVAAEYFRLHSVTDESERRDAQEAAHRYLSGMFLLNEITSTPGFMARSVCSPEEWAAGTCGGDHDTHDLEHWQQVSGDPRYEGWYFKDDTSSDEVVGHVFALTVASKLSPSSNDRSRASTLLTTIVENIVNNGYVLVGPDRNPNGTTWGKWAPRFVNEWRNFSDERGLQSLQMLSMLSAASSVSSNTSWIHAAYEELTNATNQYDVNAVNLKIQSPCDDNFSDDELSFLPILTLLMTTSSSSLVNPAIVEKALARTYSIVRPERSSLWSSIYLVGNPEDESIRDDILWNLRTWPLEHINWPLSNQGREDIVYESGVTRFGTVRSDSSHTRPPLPANERSQYRWNADPWDVSGSGGDGVSEIDPGAWLLPYWMARYYNIL